MNEKAQIKQPCSSIIDFYFFGSDSETQKELEERTHEVLDMDNALKERQGELQQRAQLVQVAHNMQNV